MFTAEKHDCPRTQTHRLTTCLFSMTQFSHSFFQNLKQEWGETKEGAAILGKMTMGKELSSEESDALKAQIEELQVSINYNVIESVSLALRKKCQRYNVMFSATMLDEQGRIHYGTPWGRVRISASQLLP